MTNPSTKKPVNDLIKFWAEKQDVEPIPRTPRRPLSPTTSLPPSPLNESFYSKSSFRDISSNTPPLTPTHIRSLTPSEECDNNNNNSVDYINGRSTVISNNNNNNSNNRSIVTTLESSLNKNDEIINFNNSSLPEDRSEKDSQNNEISTTKNISPIKTDITTINKRPRGDYDLKDNKVDKISSLPPARKVTDLVSKFEKVSSPTNSVQTSPRLTPIKRGQTYIQSSPTSPLALSPTSPLALSPISPLALSPIKRNQLTPEPISLTFPDSSTLSVKAKRRQTVPEPLNISSKKFTDEPSSLTQNTISNKNYDSTPVSPISPIGNQPISTLTTQTITTQTTKQTQQQQQQQEGSLKNDDNVSTQENVSDSNSIPAPLKRSDSEPIVRPISLFRSDYLEFVSETLKNSSFNLPDQRGSSSSDSGYSSEHGFILPEITSIWKPTTETTSTSNPENENNSRKQTSIKSIITKRSHTVPRNKNRGINVTFETSTKISKNNSSNNFEIPDLLPQPEPISPIRLNFSDFLASDGSTTNLNSNSPLDDKLNSKKSTQNEEKEKQFHDDTNIYVVETNSEASKKNENSKSMRHLSGTIQFIENLKRYLKQPNNKHKNSDDISASTKRLSSQNINDDNQLNQLY